jgi:hypothetical protein
MPLVRLRRDVGQSNITDTNSLVYEDAKYRWKDVVLDFSQSQSN